ncbi:AAR142Cp [Eremothecium gossypii ATCC 10895]|uniref:AAR142Cp n=1 Tax=Eremothecium gossypii (strain ATCC 10895 / CBS 109.51 / FGSC 9923 / NRRL Y-1056) TaxID=284811 RepID=Q75ED9_EREGS|nr:AAR142Cp [Eremothecium gossypii ATCC 10895]AAS50508.1 AAR142Cp [Eremothecium gossypii ATCC 10895]AEY94795.1 FAAR142Cp [Eremothecium gossypii FDAG1]
MARYYCDYCHAYLTHDSLSVRKSHLIGKNHIRLTADYYYNKAQQQAKPFLFPKVRSRPQGGIQLPAQRRTLHCETNRVKRQRRLIHQVAPAATPLRELYAHSPGFHKVFTPECRLDVGDTLRVSKLPQRANQKVKTAAPAAGRSEVYAPRYAANPVLPPPSALTLWGGNISNNSNIYAADETLLRTVSKVREKLTSSRTEKVGRTMQSIRRH